MKILLTAPPKYVLLNKNDIEKIDLAVSKKEAIDDCLKTIEFIYRVVSNYGGISSVGW